MASNNVYAGELTARIVVEVPESEKNGGGGKTVTWKLLFGEGISLPARWRRRSGTSSDREEHDRVAAFESALVTVRYNSRLGSTCRVRRIGDTGGPWNVVGTPNRSPNGMWLEFTVERRVAAL